MDESNKLYILSGLIKEQTNNEWNYVGYDNEKMLKYCKGS